MKINAGSGHNKLDGYINIDNQTAYNPDIVHDLNITPWPFEDNSVEEIILCHTLEHLGEKTETYLKIWQEMYRILQPDGIVNITVPHWLCENFFHDPTHCRVVTPTGINMFDNERNYQDYQNGGRETKLGLYLGIDFKIENVGYKLADQILEKINQGEFTYEQAFSMITCSPNWCEEIYIITKAVKPNRYDLTVLN